MTSSCQLRAGLPPAQTALVAPVPVGVVEEGAGGQERLGTLGDEHHGFREVRLLPGDLLEILAMEPSVGAAGLDRGDGVVVPAGMDQAQARLLMKERQLHHPSHVSGRQIGAQGGLVEEGLVLADVRFGMGPQMALGGAPLGASFRMEQDGVELVVPHESNGALAALELAHPLEDLEVARAAVDEVAKEGQAPPFGMDAGHAVASEQAEGLLQAVGIAVEVGYDVQSGGSHPSVSVGVR